MSSFELPRPSKRAIAITASSVEREAVDWLWAGRIPLRSVSLLVGDPGLGKSLLTCALAARVSREGGFALVATAEDSLSATARPRLEAAQADLDRVAFVEMQADDGLPAGLCLPEDLSEVENLVEKHGASLLIIDPLTAHLPADVNSWRDQSVRLALAPLHALADRHRCAALVVAHLNKALSAEPLRRIGGSVGIPAAARSVLLLARDPDEEDGDTRRVLAHVKCNVGPLAPSLLYELDPILLPATNGTPSVETVRLDELGESDHQGGDLLAVASSSDPEAKSALDEAKEFLRDELGGGPQPAKKVGIAAKDAGISPRTLDRAKQKLKVASEREGGIAGQGQWLWRLPTALLRAPMPQAPLVDEHLGELSESGSTIQDGGHISGLRPPYLADDELRVPLPGDEMFPVLLANAVRDGHISEDEAKQRLALHRFVEPACVE